MKVCGACLVELPEEEFSKKQWHMKKVRRCKGCVDANQAIQQPKKEVGSEHRARGPPSRNRKKRDPHISTSIEPSSFDIEGSISDMLMGMIMGERRATHKNKNKRPYKGLRFKAGDRVECSYEKDFQPGVVVKRNHWEDGGCYPYQIKLDGDFQYIYAPIDEDWCIRKSTLPPPAESPLLIADPSNDDELFKQPPSREECPICMIPLPLRMVTETTYHSCCGKVICTGCTWAAMQSGMDNCAFCRTPEARLGDEEWKRLFARVEANDPEAISLLGVSYLTGKQDLQKDEKKGFELLSRAAELGVPTAHFNLASSYHSGNGLKVDGEKARHHYETSAKAGHEGARYNLGHWELASGNVSRGYKHWMVAAKCGYIMALEAVKEGYDYGDVTKEDWEQTLKAHKASIDEMASEQRENARNAKERTKNFR